MKHFLPLLILTGLLFGQDVLITIGGSQAKGKFIEVTEKHIVFQQSGIPVPSKIPKMSVARVVLSNGDVAFFMTEEMKNQLKQRKLNAQIELRDLILKKNGKIVTIPKGDWVVAVNTFNPVILMGGELKLDGSMASGELLGISGDGILIRESGKDKERNIPFNEIGILYHSYPNEISKYILQGVKCGCILPAALAFMTIKYSDNVHSQDFGFGSFQATSQFSWLLKAFFIKLNMEYFCIPISLYDHVKFFYL